MTTSPSRSTAGPSTGGRQDRDTVTVDKGTMADRSIDRRGPAGPNGRSAVRALAAALSLSAGVAGGAHAQAASPPVDFTPFGDAGHWVVKQPLVYRVGDSRDSIVVPRGFVTDLASI